MQLISRVLGVVLALAFLSGCFGMPDHTRLTELPSLDPTVHETVLVYPMYDMRQDKELSLKLEGHFDYSTFTYQFAEGRDSLVSTRSMTWAR